MKVRASSLGVLSLVVHVAAEPPAMLQLGGAVFESRCGASDSTVKFIVGGTNDLRQLTDVRLVLHGVPFTCANVPLSQPCATADTIYPKLWSCSWTTMDGTATSSSEPLYAQLRADMFNGAMVGIGVYIDCPPPEEAFVKAHETAGSGGVNTIPLKLSLRHAGSAVPTDILFEGGSATQAVTFIGTVPPSPPFQPPPQPPSLPPAVFKLERGCDSRNGKATGCSGIDATCTGTMQDGISNWQECANRCEGRGYSSCHMFVSDGASYCRFLSQSGRYCPSSGQPAGRGVWQWMRGNTIGG